MGCCVPSEAQQFRKDGPACSKWQGDAAEWERMTPWGDVKQIRLTKWKGEKLVVQYGHDEDQKSSALVPFEPGHLSSPAWLAPPRPSPTARASDLSGQLPGRLGCCSVGQG